MAGPEPEIGGCPGRVFGLSSFPFANHDDNQHAANENLRLQNLWDGIELFGGIVAELGRAWPGVTP